MRRNSTQQGRSVRKQQQTAASVKQAQACTAYARDKP